MTKPRKYFDDNEMFLAAGESQKLVKEVVADSGLTLSALSAEMRARGLSISDGMLRQYASGQKPMGVQRKHEFALIAYYELACKGERVINTLTFDNPEYLDTMKVFFEEADQRKQFAEELFDRAIHELINWGLDASQIQVMLATALEKYERYE
jgi:hypothetical protein